MEEGLVVTMKQILSINPGGLSVLGMWFTTKDNHELDHYYSGILAAVNGR